MPDEVGDDSEPRRRAVVLEGCFNFRDLGGYSTIDGQCVRWKQLYRSDYLNQLIGNDRSTFSELGIRTIIDLRSRAEVDEVGYLNPVSPGSRYYHMPLFDMPPGEVVDRFFNVEHIVNFGPSEMAEVYDKMLHDGSERVAGVVSLLAEDGSLPALVHCTGGKDRTGIVSAVVLRLLNVQIEQVAEDYALSQPAMDSVLESTRKNFGDGADVQSRCSPVALRAEAATMSTFINRIEGRYGSMALMAAAAGVSSTTIDRLREILLENAIPGAQDDAHAPEEIASGAENRVRSSGERWT
jgi:protein-tyrosine phosphatase